MDIIPFQPNHTAEAAALFVQNFKQLRQRLPILPAAFEQPEQVAGPIQELMKACPGFAAVEDGRLVGYYGAWMIDTFRGTDRKTAYSPEWGHAALEGRQRAIYNALYRAASAFWFEQGCQAHALTLLANDEAGLKTWFWSGFGLIVLDAIRPLIPTGAPVPLGYRLAKALPGDAAQLAEIETEHWTHYAQPPTLMMYNAASDAASYAEFLQEEKNSAWVAWKDEKMVAYLRFEGSDLGGAWVVNGSGTIAITGAYTRPSERGRGLVPALLDAALRDYAARPGFERCAVDFESINPEAAAFWPKYFDLVCLSLMRVPERQPLV